jgi:hypothetical protein
MLRLRFSEPLPPRYFRRGESFPVRLQLVNERGVCPFQVTKKSSSIQLRLLDDILQPHSEHVAVLEPKKPEIDGTGVCDLNVTLLAKDKNNADVCANSVQLWFEAKVSVTPLPSTLMKDTGRRDSPATQSPIALDLNVVSPSLTQTKSGTADASDAAVVRQPSPKHCVKTFYSFLGHRVACCEGQQLVDDILPGLAHTVWDAGILMARCARSKPCRASPSPIEQLTPRVPGCGGGGGCGECGGYGGCGVVCGGGGCDGLRVGRRRRRRADTSRRSWQ